MGAVVSSICLFLMPNSGVLWMAAGLLWILDTAGNVAMEPFRAFVADKLNEKQRTRGFAMQSLMIGLCLLHVYLFFFCFVFCSCSF